MFQVWILQYELWKTQTVLEGSPLYQHYTYIRGPKLHASASLSGILCYFGQYQSNSCSRWCSIITHSYLRALRQRRDSIQQNEHVYWHTVACSDRCSFSLKGLWLFGRATPVFWTLTARPSYKSVSMLQSGKFDTYQLSCLSSEGLTVDTWVHLTPRLGCFQPRTMLMYWMCMPMHRILPYYNHRLQCDLGNSELV